MKKLYTPFSLIRKTAVPLAAAKAKKTFSKVISKESADVVKRFSRLDPAFRQAITTSLMSSAAAFGTTKPAKKLIKENIRSVAREVGRRPNVETVGILDLGAWLSGLPVVLDKLNSAQALVTFFEVQAPIPAGMIKSEKPIVEWATKEHGISLTKKERADMAHNILADEFFRAGKDIRKNLGLNYLAGLTPAMIAGSNAHEVYWNHFSSGRGAMLLISTADLRDFASQADRSFESAVACLLVGQLLAEMTPKLSFHADRGCLFDYNADRKSLVATLRDPVIEPGCLDKMEPKVRTAAESLVAALKRL
jgi:hypothetical protein